MTSPSIPRAICSGSAWSIYRLDRNTGRATIIGRHGMGSGRGLACGSGGKCFATPSNTGELFEIDVRTGAARLIGTISCFRSLSDIAFFRNSFVIYSGVNAITNRFQRQLLTVDRRTLQVTRAANVNVPGAVGVGGLANVNNQIFGFAGTAEYRLDPNTGRTTLVANFAGQGLSFIAGAAYSSRAQP